jgi:acetate kinase
VDPGAILWAQRRGGLAPADLEQALDRESGLLGVSGVSADLREVLTAAERGEGRAALALEVYLHRLRALIGAMTAALGGLDVLVFTGGVGEHSAPIRSATCSGFAYLGVDLDEDRNRQAAQDAQISSPQSRVAVLVVTAREDLEIAREVRTVLTAPPI